MVSCVVVPAGSCIVQHHTEGDTYPMFQSANYSFSLVSFHSLSEEGHTSCQQVPVHNGFQNSYRALLAQMIC